MSKKEKVEVPDKYFIMAKATTIAMGIVLLTLGMIFLILLMLK